LVRTHTYRAVCWIDPVNRVATPLTRPEHRNLDTRALLAEGRWEAERAGLSSTGRIEVIPFVSDEPFEVPEVRALRCVGIDGAGRTSPGPRLGDAECMEMTGELAEGRARVVSPLDGEDEFSHVIERTHNLDDTVLPFTVVFHAQLEGELR
jgi:hypothetical protein